MIDRTIISDKYVFSGNAHIPLSQKQQRLRDAIQQKISDGTYILEERPCLCGSEDATLISETDRYGFYLSTVICRDCGIVRSNPRLDENSLADFYRKEYQDLYFATDGFGIAEHFKAQYTNGLYLRDFLRSHMKGFRPNGMSVLEIGCSAGGILAPFLESGAAVRGYDYNDSYLAYGRSVNTKLDLRYGGIGDLEAVAERFDLIIMNHVLEHLADPKEAIRRVADLLTESGMLYISVPGVRNAQYYNSPVRSYLGSLHIAHLYQFTRNSLMSIMDGFEPIFVDQKVRGVFRRSPDRKAPSFAREYDSNLRYIMWRENSFTGAMARRYDVLLHDHHLYTRALWLMHCLRGKGKS